MVDAERIKKATLEIIEAIGEDPEREGLKDTPTRVARFWQEFVDYDYGNTDITFECITTDRADAMIIVTGMRIWSLCEHHLLPFWCDVSIGYIARDRILGLSKFARVAHRCAHRLQIQERLVHQIADEIERLTGSPDVTVFASGQHLCMIMRGIKTEGMLKTHVARGTFRDDPTARMEFLRLIAS
jgi:GTP cyclohydrolase I